jgi:phage terminase small subunit
MPRGGYRPGSGRKKGSKTKNKSQATVEREQIRQLLATGIKAKAKIYQDFLVRISKGDPLTITEKNLMQKLGAELAAEVEEGKQTRDISESDPLEYMLDVMKDPKADQETRLRAASLAAPYIHPRKGEGAGKKEEKSDRAKAAGSGKFKAGIAPVLKMVKK